MNNMRFSVDIAASKEQVWHVLWDPEPFGKWAGIIDPGTYMVGTLQEGNEIQFISAENGYGVTSLVEKLIPGEFLELRHQADTQDAGMRDREKEWTGGSETYTLVEQAGSTTVTVVIGVPPELEEYFRDAYPKALQCIKALAEQAT